MKSFTELSEQQQFAAVDELFWRIVGHAVRGSLRFNDLANGNDLQARIEAVIARGYDDQYSAHWVAHVCHSEFRALAEESARTAVYVEQETVVRIDDL